uniref:Uncharacterized protein n=1 Tax=Rhizophora mucronata TaxID=61149 RepID=A0A2P2N4M3_RHIMU
MPAPNCHEVPLAYPIYHCGTWESVSIYLKKGCPNAQGCHIVGSSEGSNVQSYLAIFFIYGTKFSSLICIFLPTAIKIIGTTTRQ